MRCPAGEEIFVISARPAVVLGARGRPGPPLSWFPVKAGPGCPRGKDGGLGSRGPAGQVSAHRPARPDAGPFWAFWPCIVLLNVFTREFCVLVVRFR